MGKAGRFACIIVPFLLTLASLICIILTFAAGQDKGKPSTLSNLYFMKADTTNFTANPDLIKGSDLDNDLIGALTTAAAQSQLADVYQVYIWDYCSGNKSNSSTDGIVTLDFCSKRKSDFYFNPEEVWGLNGTAAAQLFPKELESGLKAYKKVAAWMFAAYSVAFFATLAELVVGVFAIFSRWGSCVTSIVASVATLFTIASAITSTALYSTLVGTFDSVLKSYGIKASLGTSSLTVTWLGVAFSVGAGLFWTLSTCCCSGQSGRKNTIVEKTPYTYERVESPYMGHSANAQGGAVPMQGMGHQRGHSQAYEPFRHDSRV